MIDLLVCLLAANPTPTAGPHVVHVSQRRDAALVVAAPFGSSSRLDTSSLVASASALFERTTDLRLLSAEQAGVDESRLLACPADDRAGCWRRTALESSAALLIIVTIAPGEDADALVLFAIDLATNRRVEIGPRTTKDGTSFEALFMPRLRPFLEAVDALREYGTASLETDCVDCEVHVADGPPVPLALGANVLKGLPIGATPISVTRRGTTICESQIDVRANSAPTLPCHVPAMSARKLGVTIGSSAATAVGLALVAWSGALAAGGPARVCVGRDTSGCDYGGTPRSGSSADVEPQLLKDANGGVPLVLVGSTLMASGLVTLGGTLLLEEEQWWWPIVIGVVAGAGTAAIVAVADR